MQALLRAMKQHTSKLETFECTRLTKRLSEPRWFDTFRGLKHLRSLAIDLNLMVPTTDISLTALANSHLLFPETLRNLTFDGISRHRVHSVVVTIHREIEGSDDDGTALTQILYTLVSKFALKTLNLHVDLKVSNMDPNGQDLPQSIVELYPVDLLFFRHAADRLLKKGMWLEVKRMPWFHEPGYKLLVSPEFGVPLQPSRYYDDEGQVKDQD